MSTWYHAFDNAPLSLQLQEKLNKLGILKPVPETKICGSETDFIKDFFTPDGYPKMKEGLKLSEVEFPYIFPAMAPWYGGASVPEAIMEMDPLYRQTASSAALSWLKTVLGAAPGSVNDNSATSFNGVAFRQNVQGVDHTFAFPDTRIMDTPYGGPAAVILITDSYWNNDVWEKQGSVPLYARQQAMFQLWCWQQFADLTWGDFYGEAPRVAFIVRICGNLAPDCTIRVVEYNEREANALVNRICKARNLEQQNGLYWKRNIEVAKTWGEKVDEAYVTDDPDLYELLVAFMKTRSDRKRLERELEDITNKQEAIAVQLASEIPANCWQGELSLTDGSKATVMHALKRTRSSGSVSPDLVRSFFPYLDEFIVASGQERNTVTIDVL